MQVINERIVVGLDIGTTKVCAVVASIDSMERINVLGVGVAESDGLNRGVVVNIDRTVEAVKSAIGEAERAYELRNFVGGDAAGRAEKDPTLLHRR